MRSLSRFGIAAVTVVLGVSTALAGTASAAPFMPVQAAFGSTATVDSKSTLTASASGTTAKATYTNNTAQDLSCLGFSGTPEMISQLDAAAKTGVMPDQTDAQISSAALAAKEGKFSILLPSGKAVPVTSVESDKILPANSLEGGIVLTPGKSMTWTITVPSEFAPSVGVFCFAAGALSSATESPTDLSKHYREWKSAKATTGILGGISGGSSDGSLGNLTGSLGS